MLGKTWPDVAGYTYVRRSPGGWASKSRFQGFGFPHLEASTQERLNDQVQARVYLARRVYADTESARQNTDQGIRFVPDAGTASAVGLRWLIDPASRRPQFRLRAEAGCDLSGWRPHQWCAGDVRSHDARWQDPASLEQARHDSRRRRRLVRLRAGVLLLQGW